MENFKFKSDVENALVKAGEVFQRQVDYRKRDELPTKGMALSKLFSEIMEVQQGKQPGWRKGKNDNEPDNYDPDGNPFEIKVTQNKDKWSSNNKTNRPGMYCLIYLEDKTIEKGCFEIFACITKLDPSAHKAVGKTVNFAFICNTNIVPNVANNITKKRLVTQGNKYTEFLLGTSLYITEKLRKGSNKPLGYNEILYKTVAI